jgi:hypothetical protein
MFSGGAVRPEVGFVVHSADYRRPKTVAVNDRLSMTWSLDILRDIGAKKGPAKSLWASATPAGDQTASTAEAIAGESAKAPWSRALTAVPRAGRLGPGVELMIYAVFMLLVLLTLLASTRKHVLELTLFCITVVWVLAHLIADMTSSLTLSF